MPIGAENIGTAYVRVIADGKDFDLKDMLRGHEGDGEMEGRRLSKQYFEGFKKEWDSKPNQTALRKSIYSAMISGDAAKMFTATRNFQNFKSGLINEFGEIGRRAGQNLEDELDSGRLDFAGFRSRITDLRRDLVRAEDQLNREANESRAKMFAEAYRMNSEYDAKIIRDMKHMAMLARAYRMNEEFDLKRTSQANKDLLDTYKRLTGAVESLNKGQRVGTTSRRELISDLKELRTGMERAGLFSETLARDFDRQHDTLVRMNPEFRKYRRYVDEVADATGAAFGRGSRNNFLNFTGSVARNLIRAGGSLIDFTGYVRGLGLAMREAGSVGGAFKVLLKDVGKFAGFAVGGLAGLFGLIGPLLSIMSLLGGAVLALASSMGGALLGAVSALGSTIVTSLVGGLGIAGVALAPVIAGIGVLTLAIKNADSQTKAAFKSLGEGFAGLGDVAAKSTFGNVVEQTTRFKAILGDLTPVVRNVGDALSTVGDRWLTLMEGKGFSEFRKALEDFLPDAVKDLGTAVGEFAGAMGGVFRAAIPQAERFLDFLLESAREFNKWANSVRGQRSLDDFFQRAGDGAAALGGFLGAVRNLFAEIFEQSNKVGNSLFVNMTDAMNDWTKTLNKNPDIMKGWIDSMRSFGDFTAATRDLLLELVSAGKDVGDSLFASMADQINRWVQVIRSNPEILQNWYESAGAFARELGNIVTGLGKVFSALDNTFSRNVIVGIFEALAGAINLAAGALETIASLFGSGESAVLGFAGQVTGAVVAMSLLSKVLGAGIVANLAAFVTNVRSAETRMTALSGAARIAAGAGGLLAFQKGAESSNKWAGVLLQTLGGAATGFALGGPWGALVGGAAGAGMGLFADRTKAAGDAARVALPQISDFADTIGKIDGAATTATRKLALLSLQEQGAVAAAAWLGISTRDLVDATLGRADAQERVNAALLPYQQMTQDAIDSGRELTDTEKAMAQQFGIVRGVVRDVTEEVDKARKSAGLANGAIAPLTEILKGFRAQVRAPLRLDIKNNVPQTVSDFSALISKYKLVPKEVKTLITQFGGKLTEDQIDDLITKSKDLNKQRPTPKISVDKSEADARLNALKSNLDFVGRIHKTPQVTVDGQAAQNTINSIKNSLDALRDKHITITETHRRINIGGPQNPTPTASGGVFANPSVRLIGEAGPEAVVPLARNLSQVDPSVRALSAIAQGLGSQAGASAPTKTISADGWIIQSNSSDSEAVAQETINRLVASGY